MKILTQFSSRYTALDPILIDSLVLGPAWDMFVRVLIHITSTSFVCSLLLPGIITLIHMHLQNQHTFQTYNYEDEKIKVDWIRECWPRNMRLLLVCLHWNSSSYPKLGALTKRQVVHNEHTRKRLYHTLKGPVKWSPILALSSITDS